MKSLAELNAAYAAKFPKSAASASAANEAIAGGVAHDGRATSPFPLFIDDALGARKSSVDGHELIDYWMGHGALLLGHNHPAVTSAVMDQISRGTHYGASHELELAWGQWVQRLIPSAERVRFVSSGTEATLMAIRLARAYTGKATLIRFQGHFHGWHDTVMLGYQTPFEVPDSAGIPSETLSRVCCLPPNDLPAIVQALAD